MLIILLPLFYLLQRSRRRDQLLGEVVDTTVKVTTIDRLHVHMATGTTDHHPITHEVTDPRRITMIIVKATTTHHHSDVHHPSITMDTTGQEMITTIADLLMIIANIKDTLPASR